MLLDPGYHLINMREILALSHLLQFSTISGNRHGSELSATRLQAMRRSTQFRGIL
mgnify:FL=1